MFPTLDHYKIAWSESIKLFTIHQAPLAPFLLLLIEEAGVPLPIPGDVYIAFMGYQVSQGRIPYLAAFLLLLFAVLVGSSILYYLSSRWGNMLILKIGKYIHVDEKKLLFVQKNFRKYGIWVIIIGRHVPGFRVPITFFAGISGVPYRTFILSTIISVVFWIAIYLSIGEKLGIRVLRLFHANPHYLLILIVPILFFFGAVFYSHLRQKNKKSKLKVKNKLD